MIHDGGHNTRVVVINESGLYSLILSSKLEQAKAFKRWVTSEVLPATMPLRRLMLDFDEKGHTDEIKARLMQKSPLVVLLIEESVRRGTHVLVELPF